jgi:hypothetical protein
MRKEKVHENKIYKATESGDFSSKSRPKVVNEYREKYVFISQ